MNTLSQLRDEAVRYLNGGYYTHEVVSIIAVHHPELDEFQIEDLDKLVTIWAGSVDNA